MCVYIYIYSEASQVARRTFIIAPAYRKTRPRRRLKQARALSFAHPRETTTTRSRAQKSPISHQKYKQRTPRATQFLKENASARNSIFIRSSVLVCTRICIYTCIHFDVRKPGQEKERTGNPTGDEGASKRERKRESLVSPSRYTRTTLVE